MTFTEIWNEAYNLYTDGTKSEGRCYNDMQAFLLEQVEAGTISGLDKCYIAHDVMEAAGL